MSTTHVSLIAFDAMNDAATAIVRAEGFASGHDDERARTFAAIATANAVLALAARLPELTEAVNALGQTVAEQGPR